jgi:hypothetical protein
LIAFDLFSPVGAVGDWATPLNLAVMSMPETAMNKNGRAPIRNNQIGRSWHRRHIDSEFDSATLEEAPHDAFWNGIPRPNGCHNARALTLAELIGHP